MIVNRLSSVKAGLGLRALPCSGDDEYARLHADYADVGRYFDRVARAPGRESAPARVQSRVQSGRADDTSSTRRPATRGGTTDWTTGPAGIEPATPGFGDRCSTN